MPVPFASLPVVSAGPAVDHTTGSIASDIVDEYSEDYEATGSDMRQPSGLQGRPPRPGRQQSTFRYCARCFCGL